MSTCKQNNDQKYMLCKIDFLNCIHSSDQGSTIEKRGVLPVLAFLNKIERYDTACPN